MAAQSKVATAYVQVIPSMEGVAPKVKSYFDGAGESSGKGFGKAFGTALKVGGAAAAAGLGVILKESLGEGADLQQSLGGIETLFKDDAQSVIDAANAAYETAGLSANDYMETVTNFSASLISSLGGDTQKAAEVADIALRDMSDNANKMGTDMEAIQNAYQGFAKQNYTMLDNLKLGYGGTKTEMERLLADAQALTGVEYNIDNLADVYSAIHVIQEELGITGTTATEASTTLAGSFNSMKAAAQNVLGNLALGQPMEESLQALKETTSTFLTGNLIPMVGTIFSGLPGLIGDAIGEMGEWIGNPDNVAGVLSAMWDFGKLVIGEVWKGIKTAAGSIYEGWSGLFAPLSTNFDLTLSGGVSAGAIPGYATGLDYVPRDNFIARLHEGEMVLTKAQANAYRGGRTGGGAIVNQYFYDHYKTAADQQAAARYEQEKAVLGLG